METIKSAHAENRTPYGSPKIYRKLRRDGEAVNHKESVGLFRCGRVRQVVLGAYEHQSLPFEKLVEELQPERNLSHNPLFQVMFVLQNAPTAASRSTVKAVNENGNSAATQPSLSPSTSAAKFDFRLSLVETEQGLVGGIEYNTDLFERVRIERLAVPTPTSQLTARCSSRVNNC